jgi:hypothetical protein
VDHLVWLVRALAASGLRGHGNHGTRLGRREAATTPGPQRRAYRLVSLKRGPQAS